MTTCWDKANVKIYEISVIGKCSHFTTNILTWKSQQKKPFHKKISMWQHVALFLNAQLDINSLQRQSQKVTQEMVEITHHLSLVLNERRCFSRQLPGITRVMQAWSSSKVYLCRWVIRGNKKLLIVIPNSPGWCRNKETDPLLPLECTSLVINSKHNPEIAATSKTGPVIASSAFNKTVADIYLQSYSEQWLFRFKCVGNKTNSKEQIQTV